MDTWSSKIHNGCSAKTDSPVSRPTRREIVAGLAGLGTGVFLLDGKITAQTSGVSRRRFDLHHHFGSPNWIRIVNDMKAAGYQRWQTYSPVKAIEEMDQGGVAMSFLSLTTPGVWFGFTDDTRKLAREQNEFSAKLAADYPGRFGKFAVLPLPDSDGCLREIEYAFDTLKADGVGLLSSYANHWLGDPAFAEVFRELNRRKAVVYVHAQVPDCCRSLIPGVSDTTLEYNTDIARTIISLIENGRVLECPDINFVFSHAGGTLLALTGRFLGNQASAANLAKQADPKSRLGQLRRFYYDTALSTNPIQMRALKRLVSTSQIVFGTEYPFNTSSNIAAGLQESGIFAPDELRAIDYENAWRILPKYKS